MGGDPNAMFNGMKQEIFKVLGLNTGEQIVTWQYILVVYSQLEALALDLLRLHRGVDDETFWKDAHRLPTLYRVADLLSEQHLTSQETILILQAVANLRNSVAHKQLLYGMTTYARYDNQPIFDDQYVMKSLCNPEVPISGVNEETLERLTADVDRACAELNRLRQEPQ
jgi:hypothetical protein